MPLKRRTGYRYESQADLPGLPVGTFTGVREFDTFNCCHCQRSVLMNPDRVRPRNLCHKCDLYTCDAKFCATECNPRDESIELALKYPLLEVPWLGRGLDGMVLWDKEIFRPLKSFRQRPREV